MTIQEYIESGMIETYVFGLANTEETIEAEFLMNKYAAVKNAVNNFADALEQKALRNRLEPPPELKEKIMHLLSSQKEKDDNKKQVLFPVINNPKRYTFSVMQLSYWKNIAAASIILFIALAALHVYIFSRYETLKSKYESLSASNNNLMAGIHASVIELKLLNENVKAISDTFYTRIRMAAANGKQDCIAAVYWNRKTKELYFLKQKLPETPPGKQYQLWAIVKGKPVDAGLINDIESISKMKSVADADAFAVTLEQKGGSGSPDLKALCLAGNV